MTLASLAERIGQTGYLKGSFRLRSGQVATHYFDKFALYSDPALLGEIAEALSALIPPGTEIIAGPALGGVPLATAVSLRSGLPAVSVRGARKEYGTERIVEGCSVDGKRVCIVEDVISTGGAVIDATKALREEGAAVSQVLCIIHRGEGNPAKLEAEGLELSPLFTGADIPEPL